MEIASINHGSSSEINPAESNVSVPTEADETVAVGEQAHRAVISKLVDTLLTELDLYALANDLTSHEVMDLAGKSPSQIIFKLKY
jgi:hypothetical protein